MQKQLVVATAGRGTVEITAELQSLLSESAITNGICNVFIQHTSASLIVCENADPSVHNDLEKFIGDFVTDGDPRFDHDQEGPDDMPAHIRSVLTQTAITFPISGGRLALGTWQGVYLYEHRTSPHERRVVISAFGE